MQIGGVIFEEFSSREVETGLADCQFGSGASLLQSLIA
jgi:hypothetical protein